MHVISVNNDSPAERAGLKAGDVIVKVSIFSYFFFNLLITKSNIVFQLLAVIMTDNNDMSQ